MIAHILPEIFKINLQAFLSPVGFRLNLLVPADQTRDTN